MQDVTTPKKYRWTANFYIHELEVHISKRCIVTYDSVLQLSIHIFRYMFRHPPFYASITFRVYSMNTGLHTSITIPVYSMSTGLHTSIS